MQKLVIALVAIGIVVLTCVIVYNNSTEEEFTPEKEVEDVELKRTFVRIYYPQIGTNEILYEDRLIFTTDLLIDPYTYVVNLMQSDPKEEGMEKILDSNVKILSTTYSNNCVTIDFSKEFEECFTGNSNKLEKFLKCLKFSLKSFTEVEKVNVLVENTEIPMVTEILNKI